MVNYDVVLLSDVVSLMSGSTTSLPMSFGHGHQTAMPAPYYTTTAYASAGYYTIKAPGNYTTTYDVQSYYTDVLNYSYPSVAASIFMQSRHRPLSNSTPVSATTETPVTNVNHQQRPSTRIGSVPATPPIEGRVFEVPKLSKRLLAEVIDFGLLFFIKAFVTLTVLDAWNMEDSGFFQTEEKEITEEADYEMAMAITANLLTIELIHRLLVVLYEVCFTLQGGTPGKRTMGLSIISCTKCIPVGENRVLVQPATKVTFWRSLGRAFLKNMGTAILFPTFLPLMVVQHNRTLYDILCGTVVVESE